MVKWQILSHFLPTPKTIVPTAAASPGIDVPMLNNITPSYIPQWLALIKNAPVPWNYLSLYRRGNLEVSGYFCLVQLLLAGILMISPARGTTTL